MRFRRLRRWYYEWRLRLLKNDLRATQTDYELFVTYGDPQAQFVALAWIHVLEEDIRRYEFRLSKIPQPT